MKLPKSLLSAILIGIAVQTVPSCTKAKESPDSKTKTETKEGKRSTPYPDSCPACGMG